MSFLNKLWDETLAGPMPETGLGKLRKHNSLPAATNNRSPPALAVAEEIPITRSITVLRPQYSTFGNSDPTSSPSGSITPRTPLTPGTPGGDIKKKLTRRKSSAGELDLESAENRSLAIYDWMIMSALDRC